jgi:hypothetical protein
VSSGPGHRILWTRRALALICVASVVAPSAGAHGPEFRGSGYISSIAGVDPLVVGVLVNVIGGDARLRLSNYSGKTVVVLGYGGEPFLRFERRGVYENVNSPATYLSRTRYPSARLPVSATPGAEPRWKRILRGASYAWYDHRIHWTSRDAPEIVREKPRETHLVFRWKVPARADGKRFVISGQLGYAPSLQVASRQGTSPWLIGAVVAISILAVAALLAIGLRARRPSGGRPSTLSN